MDLVRLETGGAMGECHRCAIGSPLLPDAAAAARARLVELGWHIDHLERVVCPGCFHANEPVGDSLFEALQRTLDAAACELARLRADEAALAARRARLERDVLSMVGRLAHRSPPKR